MKTKSDLISGYNPGDQVTLSLHTFAGILDPPIVVEPANGSFHTDWTPPGTYTLMAQANSLTPRGGSVASAESPALLPVGAFAGVNTHSFASQQINAVSSISDLHLALQPTVNVALIVHGLPPNGSDERPNLLPRLFALIPRGPGAWNPEYFPGWEDAEGARSSGDLRMVFAGIPPGTYELKVGPLFTASFYVESASSGSTNLLHENLVISGSVSPIDVELRDAAATLSGTISSSGTPVPGIVVLLSDSRSKPITFDTGPSGAYQISGLAPGPYRVFATEPAVNPDYLDPAFQQRISSKIQEITLSSKQSASLNLELATVEE